MVQFRALMYIQNIVEESCEQLKMGTLIQQSEFQINVVIGEGPCASTRTCVISVCVIEIDERSLKIKLAVGWVWLHSCSVPGMNTGVGCGCGYGISYSEWDRT